GVLTCTVRSRLSGRADCGAASAAERATDAGLAVRERDGPTGRPEPAGRPAPVVLRVPVGGPPVGRSAPLGAAAPPTTCPLWRCAGTPAAGRVTALSPGGRLRAAVRAIGARPTGGCSACGPGPGRRPGFAGGGWAGGGGWTRHR